MGDIDRHLLVFGKLKFPKGAAAKWRSSQVHAERWSDWPTLLEGGHLEPTTVAEVLTAVSSMNADQGELVVSGKDAVSIHGFLLEPGTLAWSRDVATPFRSATEAGAKGDVTFLQMNGEGGVRVIVTPSGARIDELLPDDAMNLLSSLQAADALGRYTMATSPPPPAEPAGPSIFDEIREDLASALAATPDVQPQQLATREDVQQAFVTLAGASPAAAVPFAVRILRSGHDSSVATFAGFVLRDSADPEVAKVMIDYAAPADRPSPPVLAADVAMVLRKPSLYENIAALRSPDLVDALKERFDALLHRTDSDAGLARLTGALLTRRALDPARATAIADRLPTQFGSLRPAPKKGPKR